VTLCRNGIALREALKMTPRQAAAFLHFIDRDEAMAEARSLVATALASHGKKEDIEKYLTSLTG
jgi:hypothetical protein